MALLAVLLLVLAAWIGIGVRLRIWSSHDYDTYLWVTRGTSVGHGLWWGKIKAGDSLEEFAQRYGPYRHSRFDRWDRMDWFPGGPMTNVISLVGICVIAKDGVLVQASYYSDDEPEKRTFFNRMTAADETDFRAAEDAYVKELKRKRTNSVPKSDEFGPDLAFVEILPGERLARLKAISSFWSLDKKADAIMKEFGSEGTPIASIGFPQLDYKTAISGNDIHHTVRHMTFSNVIQKNDVFERDGWDYLESTLWYGGSPNLPLTFSGVSGGPVWGMHIRKHKSDGHFSIEKSALIGITFYQTGMKGDERRLRAHFIKSIYDLAWRDIK